MGLLGGALGAIGKGLGGGGLGGGLLKGLLGGGGEGGGGAGGGGQILQQAMEAVGGIKGLVDQFKGGGQAQEAQQAQPQAQAQGQQQGQEENPLMRLAKAIFDAKPEELPKIAKDLKSKLPKELGQVIDKLVEAKQQMA